MIKGKDHQACCNPYISLFLNEYYTQYQMNRTFNIPLVLGCVVSIAAAFIISVKPAGTTSVSVAESETVVRSPLPTLQTSAPEELLGSGIHRQIELKTQLQDDVSYKITKYTVKSGESLWSIGKQFNLKPETILWGYEWLSSIGILKIGDILEILPIDGVLHKARTGDTIERLQTLHGTPAQEIFEYFGNNFDLTQPPQLSEGQEIIIPNGTSPIVWSEARAPGAVTTYSGKYPNLGTGYFVW